MYVIKGILSLSVVIVLVEGDDEMDLTDKIINYYIGRYKAKIMLQNAVDKIISKIDETIKNNEELKNILHGVKLKEFNKNDYTITIYDSEFILDTEDLIHNIAQNIKSYTQEDVYNLVGKKLIELTIAK